MKKYLNYILIPILLVLSVLSACGGDGNGDNTRTGSFNESLSQSYSGQLVTAIAEAETEKERQQAIDDIVSQGFSLGLVDAEGKQLNPNVPENAVSLSLISMANYSMMDTGSHYRTVEYVVGFLADAGVELESTGALINVEDFLPDLQEYVEWSFDHPNDPASALGLMIASGQGMAVPDSPPIITGKTTLSPLVSLLMMGDILIGIETEKEKPIAGKGDWFVGKAYADTDRDKVIESIRGLITTIKGITIVKTLLPDKAQSIMAAFEACDRLSVRMWEVPDASTGEENWINNLSTKLPVAKNFKLEKDKTESITILGGVGIMSGASGTPPETVQGVETLYFFQLLSPDEEGTGVPLYDDVDAELNGFKNGALGNYTYSSDLNGHLLAALGKGNAPFVLDVKNMSNPKTRKAVLHASAEISAPEDLYSIAEQALIEKLGLKEGSFTAMVAMAPLGTLPWEDINETLTLLNRDFQPTPWMCTVEFSPVETKALPATEEPEPSPPVVTITSPADGAIFEEGEDIIVAVTAIDCLGKPLSEYMMHNGLRWESGSDPYLACNLISDGKFRIGATLHRGEHTITVSIVQSKLKGSDTIKITVIPEQLTIKETLIRKRWELYLRDDTQGSTISFKEDGTFSFMNPSWNAEWTLSGSSITLIMTYEYKTSGMVQNLKLTGTITEAKDGYYYDATMKGEYESWFDHDKEGSMETGTWTAD